MSNPENHASGEVSPFGPGGSGRVIGGAAASQPPALAVRAGEELTAVGYDERWPGYVLCGNLQGHAGWVPESVLTYIGSGMAVVRGDYTAAVLAVERGDEVSVHLERNGWYWATRAGGQSGWVRAEHVRILDEG